MIRVSRRSFLSVAGGIPLALALRKYGFAQAASPRVRYECRSVLGAAMLQIYALGVARMRSLPSSDPRSWVFQWYTHQVSSTTNKTAAIAATFTDPNDPNFPNRALAEAMWNTCQAHNQGDDENQFLPWHRCFLLFFEQIIADLSGHPEFTLPYWNYSTIDPTLRGVIPPQFTTQSDATYRSLYDNLRYPSVNAGQPIQNSPGAQFLGPGDPLNLDFLSEQNYEPQEPVLGFNLDLDSNLHGNVHTLIGGPQNMGSIPDAAQDPIFWMHHCNIDRLWASWSAAGGVTPPTISQTFTFVDGNGDRTSVDTKNYLDTSNLGYTYDRLEPVPPITTAAAPRTAAAPQSLPLADNGSQALHLTPTSSEVTLQPVALPQQETVASFAAKSKRRVFVVLKGLSANGQPGVLYNAYLNLPPNATPQQQSDHFIGIVNFFAFAQMGAGNAMPMVAKPGGAERFLSFDVTSKMLAMQLNKSARVKPVITLVARGTPAANADPVIGKAQIVVQ